MAVLPTYFGADVAVESTSGSAATQATTDTAVNDIMIALCEAPSNSGFAATTNGFTEFSGSPFGTGSGTTGTWLKVLWKRATASGGQAGPVFSQTNHTIGRVFNFRGCATSGNPWDVSGGSFTSTASTGLVMVKSLTTTEASTLVFAAASEGFDSASVQFSSWGNSNLASIVERSDVGTALGNGGGLGAITGTRLATGRIGGAHALLANSFAQSWFIIALKGPAAAGPSTSAKMEPMFIVRQW